MMDERELRRAFPEMSNTLSNWTLHGQNLGSMLSNYRSQCRNMKRNQRHELAHFFNTTSNILDTIGSMTENTILRSVEFNKKGGGLKGGGVFGNENKGLNNKPPPALFPNAENLSRYTAIFPGHSFDNGHVLAIEPNVGEKLFTSEYPSYPESVVLRSSPNLPVREKFYSTTDNESSSSSSSSRDTTTSEETSGDEGGYV